MNCNITDPQQIPGKKMKVASQGTVIKLTVSFFLGLSTK